MTRTLLAALVTLGDPGQLTGGYLFHRRLAELAPNHAARLKFVSFPSRTFPLSIVDAAMIVRELSRMDPDVVVLDSIAAAFMAFTWPDTPMVGMLHQPPGGIDYEGPRRNVQAVLDRLAYRHVRRLLVASDSLADELRDVGERAERIYVVPPGRDVVAAAEPIDRDLRQGRRAAFLCVGNWVGRKDVLSLLEAMAHLEGDAATLHLVGNTAAEPAYARRVWARLRQSDLRGRVVVHGPLPIARVAGLYEAADAFALTSLKEPYGTVYGEAMTAGLPVVGWRAGNLPYLADDEREGFLIAPGDITGLTEALRRLADDADLGVRLGTAARQRAMARPTWDDVARAFFAHLREVAE
jgi:glycosyltransferase involved in cell wall biosynthesis